MKKVLLLAMVGVLLLALVGCGKADSNSSSETTAETVESSAGEQPAVESGKKPVPGAPDEKIGPAGDVADPGKAPVNPQKPPAQPYPGQNQLNGSDSGKTTPGKTTPGKTTPDKTTPGDGTSGKPAGGNESSQTTTPSQETPSGNINTDSGWGNLDFS